MDDERRNQQKIEIERGSILRYLKLFKKEEYPETQPKNAEYLLKDILSYQNALCFRATAGLNEQEASPYWDIFHQLRENVELALKSLKTQTHISVYDSRYEKFSYLPDQIMQGFDSETEIQSLLPDFLQYLQDILISYDLPEEKEEVKNFGGFGIMIPTEATAGALRVIQEYQDEKLDHKGYLRQAFLHLIMEDLDESDDEMMTGVNILVEYLARGQKISPENPHFLTTGKIWETKMNQEVRQSYHPKFVEDLKYFFIDFFNTVFDAETPTWLPGQQVVVTQESFISPELYVPAGLEGTIFAATPISNPESVVVKFRLPPHLQVQLALQPESEADGVSGSIVSNAYEIPIDSIEASEGL